MPVHDYSDIQPIQFPFHMEEGKGSKKQFNFSAIENENSDIGVSHLSSKQVIENESPLEKMLTVLTGKTKSQRSSKDKAVKFPLKLMYVWTCGDYDHIVHWKENQIDGSDVFVVDDIDAFTSEILPSLFKVAKFVSFQRKMYRWGILKSHRSRSDKKKGCVSYSHPLFKKGDFFLAAQMSCSGAEVETQKNASKQKKKVQRQEIQSQSVSKRARKVSTNHNIPPVASANTSRDDLDDLTLSVYSPEDGLMTSMRVSSILKHANKEPLHLSRRTDEEKASMSALWNQMYYNRPSYTNSNSGPLARSFLEPMPNLNPHHTFPIEGNPNFLPLSRVQETQEGIHVPIQTYRNHNNDVRRFCTDSVEFSFPSTLNMLNSEHLLRSARERNVFEC